MLDGSGSNPEKYGGEYIVKMVLFEIYFNLIFTPKMWVLVTFGDAWEKEVPKRAIAL